MEQRNKYRVSSLKQGGDDVRADFPVYLDGMRSYAVRRIRDRIKVPEALSDTDFILDVVFRGILVPDEIKDRLREEERKMLENMYCNRKIPVEKLQGIEQLNIFPKIVHHVNKK